MTYDIAPSCSSASPLPKVQTARELLSTEPVIKTYTDCQQRQTGSYLFDEKAQQLLKTKKYAFIVDINNTIEDRSSVPPKSKQLDSIPLQTASNITFVFD